MKIDITTTATLRPRIVERTLWSFWRLLFKGHDVRLILNVDPVGEKKFTQQNIVDVASHYYPNIVVRTPDRADYIDAVKWAWSQVRTDYFFFLEDDYQLYCPLDLKKMYTAMEEHPQLALLRLPKGRTFDNKCFWAKPNRGHVAQWNGSYYSGSHMRFTGMPSLIRTSFMRGFLAELKPDRDIELQFRTLRFNKHPCTRGWKYGVFAESDTPITVEDIGRAWRARLGITKNPSKRLDVGFLHWVQGNKPMLGGDA